MRALIYTGANELVVEEKPIPVSNPGEVLIKVAYAGICGTDMHCYHGGMDNRVKPPVTLGHEFSGIVEDAGNNSALQKGEKVTVEPILSCGKCNGCKIGEYNLCSSLNLIGIDSDGAIASYITVPEKNVYPLGEKVSMKEGALVEPLAVCMHLLEKAKVKEKQTILIIGSGPIGIITALVARIKGANVIISEINEYRIQFAQQLGFSVINPSTQNLIEQVTRLTEGKGSDISIEATGSNVGLVSCLEAAGVKGKVIIAGLPKTLSQIDTYKIIAKELEIIGTRVYKQKDYKNAINLLESGEFNSSKLISRIVTLEDAIEHGFKAIDREEQVVKILISLGDEDK